MQNKEGDVGLQRSHRKFDRATIARLFSLCMTQPWLETRQLELGSVFDICSCIEEQSLVSDLLARFSYISSEELSLGLDKIVEQVQEGWSCAARNTTIAAISRSPYSDSSQAILWNLKPKLTAQNGWSTRSLVVRLDDCFDVVDDGGTLVLIDEFAGTGETLAKAIIHVRIELEKRAKKVRLFVCCLAAMERAIAKMDDLKAEFFCVHMLKRGITDYYADAHLTDAIAKMMRMETELAESAGGQKLKKFLFGYKRSEALYYLENGNVPNNVFPIFWWPSLKNAASHTPLLSRL